MELSDSRLAAGEGFSPDSPLIMLISNFQFVMKIQRIDLHENHKWVISLSCLNIINLSCNPPNILAFDIIPILGH